MTSRASAPRVCSPPDSADGGRPLVAGEPEAGQRLVDALVERVAAEHLEPMLERPVGGLRDVTATLELASSTAIALQVGGAVADRRPQVRRGHERLVEVRLLGEQAERQPALAGDLAADRARRGPAAIRSSVVLPAPFGPTRPTRSPRAIARVDLVEDHERADLAANALEPQDRHQPGSGRRGRGPAPAARRGGRRRRAAARRVRSARDRLRSRLVRARPPDAPSPSSSVQRRSRAGPAPSRPRVIPAEDRGRARPIRRPAAAGTTSRSASPAPRRRSAGSGGRSGGTARRSAGRPASRSCI